MVAPSLSERLVQSLGDEAFAPLEQLDDYSVDGATPEVAVFPEKVEAVAEVLRLAGREHKKVTPRGGGTQMALGNIPTGVDLVLGLNRLNRILFHEPAEMVAGVEAGITLEVLQEQLAKRGQFLPLGAPIPTRATVGGILAANASGPSRLAYGTPRDWLIGIKVVHSDGTVTKSGGKVVKNVSGYDLNKLYVGSLGTLGVIVEANLKVAPLPPDLKTMLATYPSLSTAMDSAEHLLRQSSAPHALQVINGEILVRLPDLRSTSKDKAAVLALFAGRTQGVKRKLDDSSRVMEDGGARVVHVLSQGDGDRLWQALADLGWAGKEVPHLMVKVSILPSQVSGFLSTAGPLGGSSFLQGMVADVGSGVVRLLWWTEDGLSPAVTLVEDIRNRLREEVGRCMGHLVVERCPLELKRRIDVWGDSAEGMTIMRRIKRELDPAGILNPGRFAGGI